jgi:hypothetical protein
MPSMPIYRAGKGSQFGLLDRQFGGDKSNYMAAYDAALQRLNDTNETLENLAGKHKKPGELSDKDVDHFAKHWLQGANAWWPDDLPVAEVLRAGYAEAIRRARTLELPIESIWICADEKDDEDPDVPPPFHVYIVEGPRQVTVIVYTPKPKEHVPADDLTEAEPIWVVKAKDKYDPGDPRAVRKGQQAGKRYEIIARQIRYAP